MLQQIIQRKLQRYAKRYIKKHDIKLVAVMGSVGKTTTKIAIATVLGEKLRVRTHEGNHNTHLSAPLAIVGVSYPDDVHSVKEWLAVFKAARLRIRMPKDTDVVVQELGTDKPGDMSVFAKYLKPDVAVVTAVGLEHMEFFGTLDAVAKEELAIAKKAQLTLVNRDDIDGKYAKYLDSTQVSTYGTSQKAEYRIEADYSAPLGGVMGTFDSPEWDPVSVNLQLVGEHSIKAAAAAGAVGVKLGLSLTEIAVGMAKIRPVTGRMNVLRGVVGSTIIDDSYNASPMAVEAALKTLYAIDAPQRIAILGSMNEFGELSAGAHTAVGQLCDPSKLEWVITVGSEAEKYLAPAAKKRGCQVRSFLDPYQAGGFAHSVIKANAVVLAKGSQNGVFVEEAVKTLLHDADDASELVRQSPEWQNIKKAQFTVTTLPEDDDV